MKIVDCIDCDVIQDLLPSYNDKILSNSSNKLVEKHLEKCKKCSDVLNSIDKEIPNEIINNQEEQIDYLKGYRRKKIKSVVLAVVITLYILLATFVMLYIYDLNTKYVYPIEELEATLKEEYINIIDKYVWNLHIYNIKHSFNILESYTIEKEDGIKEIYIKFGGDHPIFGRSPRGTRTVLELDIDETVDKIYLENEKGDLKEVWNPNKAGE